MKYWEIIADRLSKAGWSLGWVSAVDSEGTTIWTVDAQRDGKRFVVRADEKLNAFVELEREVLREQQMCSICQLVHSSAAVGSAKVSKV